MRAGSDASIESPDSCLHQLLEVWGCHKVGPIHTAGCCSSVLHRHVGKFLDFVLEPGRDMVNDVRAGSDE